MVILPLRNGPAKPYAEAARTWKGRGAEEGRHMKAKKKKVMTRKKIKT